MGSRIGPGSTIETSATEAAITVAWRAGSCSIMTSAMFACFLAMRFFDGVVRVVRICASPWGETFVRSVVW